jgi:prepilin-type N-terminal cleavage/methylation domain-containing protein
MLKNQKGFTLLELMVVLTIIAILAALVAPRVLNNIQYGKQIGTMRDIKTIADACLAYAVEHNEAPAAGTQDGPLSPGNDFVKVLTEKILTTCPVTDKWGNPLVVYSGTALAHFGGFTESTVGKSDFIIISYGRKGTDEHFVFDSSNREAGLFESNTMADYDKNLINWNGTWIRAPKS